ncbi:TonB-dependent receptor [Methylococcus sp. EFPC2]|uniref:TonB-dependent receptor n=1 Tax=Methylococcus sp. EFPC2 TaxID=2812648 RepID=UPI0019671CA2|nr:TonB-dependent receptor [Methylococcus sp. EFPC2]QSA96986.1 TonB-dependent receptor [Methylococcus sp. EFPC2]
MSNTSTFPSWAEKPVAAAVPFRRSSLVLAIAGAVMVAGAPAYAADDKVVSELKAEVERLKKALEKSEKALAAQVGAVPAQPAAGEPVSEPVSEPPAAVQSEESTKIAKGEEGDEPKALGEVVVRTSRGLVKKHDIPTSSSVITGQELEQTGAYTLADFTKRSANLSRDTGNPRTFSLAIRGIGKKGITEAQDPSVGTSIDGISFGYNSLATWDQVDVESVEVNRGPQGTYGGKNTSLGSVQINSRTPSFTSGGRYAMRFGILDTFYGDLSYGGPVIDNTLAWRGTFFVHKNAGVYQNDYDLRGRTYIDTNKIAGRVQFLYTPTDDITARLRVEVAPRTAENFNGLNLFHPEPATYSDGVAWNLANSSGNRLRRGWFQQIKNYGLNNFYNYHTGTQNNDQQLALETGMHGVTGDVNWKLGTHTLTSITGWKDFYFDARNDEGTPYDVSLQGGGDVKYAQFTQELKLSSEKGGFVDYVTGLYYIKTRTDVGGKNGYGSDAGYWFASGSPSTTNTFLDPVTGTTQPVWSGTYGTLAGSATATAQDRYLLGDSLNGLRKYSLQRIRNESPAVFGTANWHLTDQLTLTTGLRVTREDRRTNGYSVVTDDGYAGVLNPTGVVGGQDAQIASGFDSVNVANNTTTYLVNNKIATQAQWVEAGSIAANRKSGAYYLNGAKQVVGTDVSAATAITSQGLKADPSKNIAFVATGTSANNGLTTDAADYAAALDQANKAALKYYGVSTWAGLNNTQRQKIALAQALRKAQIGTLYNTVGAQSFRKTQLTSLLSPSFKINDDHTVYATWQHGEKAGIAQVVSGKSLQAKPEITESYELGWKAYFFDKSLTLNTDVFYTDITDYQQAIQVVDEKQTLLNNDGLIYYQGATLNADRVKAWGIEVDGSYTGIPRTSLRWSGAYTDAWYADFKNSPLAAEQNPGSPLYSAALGGTPFQDLTGKTLPGASKFSFNVGGDYRQPVLDGYEAHTSINYSFQTGYNNDVTLSKYGWVHGYGTADVSIGLGRKDKLFDVSFLARNVLDTQPKAQGSNSGSLLTSPRWYGVVVSGQF